MASFLHLRARCVSAGCVPIMSILFTLVIIRPHAGRRTDNTYICQQKGSSIYCLPWLLSAELGGSCLPASEPARPDDRAPLPPPSRGLTDQSRSTLVSGTGRLVVPQFSLIGSQDAGAAGCSKNAQFYQTTIHHGTTFALHFIHTLPIHHSFIYLYTSRNY